MSQSQSSSNSSPASVVILRLPKFTIQAPWPLPYSPLTTAFTPPSQCNDKWTLMSESTNPSSTSIGQFIDLLNTNDATCLPPGYRRDVWSATFSPGIYCPSGYEIAATGTEVYTAVWEKGLSHSAGERSIVCCLSGFDYTKLADRDACISSYDHSTSVLTRDYLGAQNQFFYTESTEVGSGTAIGHPIHLRHNDAEFKALFTGVPADEMTSSSNGGLSTGAIAGIAAGCGVIGLCALGAGIWFILRHRRRRSQNEQPKSEDASVEMVYTEPPAREPPPAAEWTSKEVAVTETKKSSRSSRKHRDRGEEGSGGHSRRHRK